MLQSGSCHNLVRFPATRYLDADYGAVLANTSGKLEILRQLENLVNKQGIASCQELVSPPHLTVVRPVDNSLSITERKAVTKDELFKQVSSLQHYIAYQQKRIYHSEAVIKTLLLASKSDPAGTAQVLWSQCRDRTSKLKCRKGRNKLVCANGNDCQKTSLPFSKFCLEHQSCDPDQKLYPSCSNLDTNSLKCNQTVLDIFSDTLLCPQHSSEATPALHSKRKAVPLAHTSQPQKKAKLGASKLAKERKSNPSLKVKYKVPEVTKLDIRPPPLTTSWNSDEDTTATATTADPAVALEDSKPTASSKSLDDLLTLDSTAPLPKLDLLPLKADIGEIMMAGEDDSNDEQQ